MLSFNMLLAVALGYAGLLFLVAFLTERRARAQRANWLRSPTVYTLSLSIYCTGWTFFGAVGYAARWGLEFVTIYLGPTIVMIGWWALLRKLVRIGKTQRITSIADLLSSRYGKSALIGGAVTILAVVGTTPYIALQLQSVTASFEVFAADEGDQVTTGFWVAAGLALFTILFGTRSLDVDERHNGVVIAIAVEAVVKLIALCAVGIFVVWGVAGGPAEALRAIEASPIATWEVRPDRWITMTFLAAAAFLCLPRMFHVLVVEATDERQLAVASWAFPAYLLLISLFVVPIAAVGLAKMPETANPDLFVITLPLEFSQSWLAMLSFLGGFSAATSMVVVASIALSTMVSNHVVMPLWLHFGSTGATVSGDVRNVIVNSRRATIAAVLGLGYLYYRFSGGGEALAAMGLIAFVGVAQVLPALIGGIFWRGSTRIGAGLGLVAGFALWLYTLFLPSLGEGVIFSARALADGPWGIGLLRPQALWGFAGLDPLVHAVFWSLSANVTLFFVGSFLSFPHPLERLQGATFVNIFRHSDNVRGHSGSHAEAEDLLVMAQRIIGPGEAQALFVAEAEEQGKRGYLPDVTPSFLERLERKLSGSVGAATAHAMLGQITGGVTVSVEDLMRVADETAQMLEQRLQLEAKSRELERTARQLREANEKLTQLSVQKDAFLSQISHELRTPMTSIRAFSEILGVSDGMGKDDRQRYAVIIHDESLRLTRLLDDLLDLSVLEAGEGSLDITPIGLREVLDRTVTALDAREGAGRLRILRRTGDEDVALVTDADRLVQVFINVVANAQKYCDVDQPTLKIVATRVGGEVRVDFIDNGPGIPADKQGLIFEKFARLSDTRAAGGAGLGLAICREIMARLGGAIDYLPGQGGAAFRVTLPVSPADQKRPAATIS
ncbi:MAG: ATP-binding protein [Pseudomonadota bacterium]